MATCFESNKYCESKWHNGLDFLCKQINPLVLIGWLHYVEHQHFDLLTFAKIFIWIFGLCIFRLAIVHEYQWYSEHQIVFIKPPKIIFRLLHWIYNKSLCISLKYPILRADLFYIVSVIYSIAGYQVTMHLLILQKKNLLNLIRCPLDVETSDAAAWIKTLESI